MSSNICPEDYAAFREARIESGEWTKPAYKDRDFWIGNVASGVGLGLDTWTTSRAQPWAIERNPIAGPHPSNERLVILGLAGYGAYVGLNALSYHFSHNDPSKFWRTFGKVSIAATALAIHVPLARHNYQLVK